MSTETEFKQYKRKGLSEMRPYIKGEDLSKISVAAVDNPEEDMGMVARNPLNHELPTEVVRNTRAKYTEAFERLTGARFDQS